MLLLVVSSPAAISAFKANPLKIVTIIPCEKTDSAMIRYRQTLLDSIITLLNKIGEDRFNFQFLENDHSGSIENADSHLEKIAAQSQAQLLLSGELQKTEDGIIKFYPVLFHFYFNSSETAETDALAGQICLPKKFNLAPIENTDVNSLVKFFSGYALFLQQNYPQAISEWNQCQLSVCSYFIGAANLKQILNKNIGSATKDTHVDSCLDYFKNCLSSSITADDSSFASNNLGVAFQISGQLDSARFHFVQANRYVPKIQDWNARVTITNNLGNIYLLSGKWNQALDVFNAAILELEAAKDTSTLAATYENLGYIYQLIYQRNKAVEFHQKALALRKSAGNKSGTAVSMRCLGDIFAEQKDLNKAKSYFLAGLNLDQNLGNEPGVANFCDRLGQLYNQIGYPDSALFYFQKSAELYQLLENEILLFRTLQHQASFFQNVKNYTVAQSIYERTLQIAENLNNPVLLARVFDRLGDLSNSQDNLPPAIDYYQQSANLYQQTANFENLSLIYYSMGLIRLKQNEYEGGYQFLSQALKIDEEHGFGNLTREKKFVEQVKQFFNKE